MKRPKILEENNDLLEQVNYLIEMDKYCDYLEEQNKQLSIHVVSISLLKKYMQHVENCEGVNFVSDIGMSWSGIEFNKEEKALLEKLDEEIEESNEC